MTTRFLGNALRDARRDVVREHPHQLKPFGRVEPTQCKTRTSPGSPKGAASPSVAESARERAVAMRAAAGFGPAQDLLEERETVSVGH